MHIQESTVGTVGEGWRGLEVNIDLEVWKAIRHIFKVNRLSPSNPGQGHAETVGCYLEDLML